MFASGSQRVFRSVLVMMQASVVVGCGAFLHGASPIVPKAGLRDASRGKCDQDDLCFWRNESEPEKSLILTSDKKGGFIRTYDLSGRLLQTLKTGKPGNIDIRQGVLRGKERVPLVCWNQREPEYRIRAAILEPKSGKLELIDGEGISTEPNYGGTLYQSGKTGKLFFLCTTKGDGEVSQYELDLSATVVTGKKVRGWMLGESECALADDATGVIYIAEEAKGVWQVGAEPSDPAPGELVAKVGENELTADVEGLTLGPNGSDAKGWLIVSSQGSNQFQVYDRKKSHAFVGRFSIEGATATDGIELLPGNFGERFPEGIFGCHTDAEGHPILLSSWREIVTQLTPTVSKAN